MPKNSKSPKVKSNKSGWNTFKEFPELQEIESYLDKIAKENPNRVKLENIGLSIEGRTIRMVIISKDGSKENKNSILIDGGIHAREWLSHTTVLYVIHYLVGHSQLLNYMDFYIIPCLNPDSYEYTHRNRRLWRKNMNKNNFTESKNWGVDLNRNFSCYFGGAGSSDKPCSELYRGRGPLSEPESESLANVMKKYSQYIKLYISIHAYGNCIMYPWGYTKEQLRDYRDLHDCAEAAKEQMRIFCGDNRFKVGSLARKMYIASGGTIDYARSVHHIKFVYTIELQKGGKSGFTASPTKIVSVAEEAMIGIKTMVLYVHRYYKKMEARKLIKLNKKKC